jgi:hypothetical protein
MGAVKRPGNSKISPRRILAAERQRQAMQLRIAGASFGAIANELGYADRKGAERAIISGLRAYFREPAQDLLPLELERLDRMQMALWPEALAGNVQAVMAVLRIMERRAKYTGLDAPHKVDANITSRATMDVNVAGGVLVIQGDKEAYLAGLRALRGEPAAIEGSSSVVDSGQPIDVDDLPDDEPED